VLTTKFRPLVLVNNTYLDGFSGPTPGYPGDLRSALLRRLTFLACCISLLSSLSLAQSNTDVYKVTSPIHPLTDELGTPNESSDPYQSGTIPPKTAKDILGKLHADPSKPTIIHLLRWKDKEHSAVKFQKWYFYDPNPPRDSFYLQTSEQVFQRTAIPGYDELQFVYIHLNAVLNAGVNEWEQRIAVPPQPVGLSQSLAGGSLSTGSTIYVKITAVSASGESIPSSEASITLSGACNSGSNCSVTVPMPTLCTSPANGITGCTVYSSTSQDAEQQQTALNACVNITADRCTIGVVGSGDRPPATPGLLHPVSYTVTVTKAQTQFIQDLKTALQILGLQVPGALAPVAVVNPGYYSVTTFQSQWTTSGITIAASLDSSNKSQGKSQNSASNSLSSNTYTNEKPSWIGLSAGVQITSYKDVTFQSSSGTLVPSSITKQDVYFFLDGYLPPVLPSLTTFRYIPHPFFGVPIKGEVLRHTMVGAGIGMHWLEPFGGVVFDTQNNRVTGPSMTKTGITYRYVFGLKVSMSAVAKALKSK